MAIVPPPAIDRVAPGTNRPLLSVMIPTWNCAQYLRETLASVLCQDLGPERMEIEVIDDCSTKDDPEAVVQEIGGGRVRFFRQPANVGAIGNFNSCIRRATGEWVHILHGDDTVRPGFYDAVLEGIASDPGIGAVATRIINIDGDGHWMNLLDLEARAPGVLGEDFKRRLLFENRFQFAGMVVRRALYEATGGFRPELIHCADWDMWKRIAVHSRIFYEPRPMACYRIHAGADTARLMRTGENVVDLRRAIEISLGYVPPEQAQSIYRGAMTMAALRTINGAQNLWRGGNYGIALRQIREAVRCSFSPTVIRHLIRLLAWTVAR